METSLYNHLKNVNPNWTSKSRIYGEAVESWVEKNIQCDCLGSYIIQKANYKGFIGIEYEGSGLPEHEGILMTKKLLLRHGCKA